MKLGRRLEQKHAACTQVERTAIHDQLFNLVVAEQLDKFVVTGLLVVEIKQLHCQPDVFPKVAHRDYELHQVNFVAYLQMHSVKAARQPHAPLGHSSLRVQETVHGISKWSVLAHVVKFLLQELSIGFAQAREFVDALFEVKKSANFKSRPTFNFSLHAFGLLIFLLGKIKFFYYVFAFSFGSQLLI